MYEEDPHDEFDDCTLIAGVVVIIGFIVFVSGIALAIIKLSQWKG
jgi:hypothetical protein